MPYRGSHVFEAYTRTLRRVYWANFVDQQMMNAAGPQHMNTASTNAAASDEPRMAIYPYPAPAKPR